MYITLNSQFNDILVFRGRRIFLLENDSECSGMRNNKAKRVRKSENIIIYDEMTFCKEDCAIWIE